MAKIEETTTGITTKYLGLSVEAWITVFQSLGIPTLFMVWVCWMVYSYLPPVASAHIELLKRTGDTLESMDETLTQSNKMLDQLANQQYPQEDFRDMVHEEHMTAEKMLEEIKRGVDKLNGAE